jgi:hypothetical protein
MVRHRAGARLIASYCGKRMQHHRYSVDAASFSRQAVQHHLHHADDREIAVSVAASSVSLALMIGADRSGGATVRLCGGHPGGALLIRMLSVHRTI